LEFYDWLLFLHVGSAFALVSALVTFWSVAVAARNVDRPVVSLRYFKITKPAQVLITVGTIGTLIFGIWLAIDASAYQVWDGWVLIALALWLVAAGTGQRGGQTYQQAEQLARQLADGGRADESSEELRVKLQDRRAMWLNVISSVAVVLILVDMIYKPGA
jgi:hypothetical protein